MSMSYHPTEQLACALDEHGFGGLPLSARRTLESFVAEVRTLNVAAVLVDVLADPAQTEVARLRAFGRITSMLDAVAQRPTLRPAA
ncbi:MAG: hypothetical protein ACR2HP_04250 [Ilumatobacteraceae bacterium]